MTISFDWETIPEKEYSAYKQRVALIETILDKQIDRGEKQRAILKYCEYHGVAKRTIRNYIKRYKRKGARGLLFYHPRPPVLRIKDRHLRKKIRRIVKENPARSVSKIRELLSLDEQFKDKIAQVSDRTIYRFLCENGMSQKERHGMLCEIGRKAYHQFEAPYSMALIQGDARDGIWITRADGKTIKTYLFLWICDYSRKILFGKYYENEKLPCMEDSFKHMVLRYGIPVKIYLDNGKVYVSRHFSSILAALRIKQIHHKPYQAYAKGKIEVVNRTIKYDFQKEAERAGMRTLEELNTAFWAWCELVYNKRIHSSTGQTPDERFITGLPKGDEAIRRIENIEEFSLLFLEHSTRTITRYGKIKLYNNQYPVQSKPHGTVVRVRFDPFDLSEIHVYDSDGTFLENTTPSKYVNNRAPKITEESRKSPGQISQESVNYFTALREKYLKEMKSANQASFSRFKKDNDKEQNDE
jgi:putative transposase